MGAPELKDERWWCDLCEIMLIGREAYEDHHIGKKHKKNFAKKRTAEDSITNGLAQTNLGAISVKQAAPAVAAAQPNAASGLGSRSEDHPVCYKHREQHRRTSENSITHDEAGDWHLAEAGDWHLADAGDWHLAEAGDWHLAEAGGWHLAEAGACLRH
jgi:hypothetical protein